MTSANRPSTGDQAGATPVGGERRRRRGWLLPLLLAVAAVVVLLLLLSQCGDDGDNDTAGGAATPTTEAQDRDSAASPSPSEPRGTPTTEGQEGAPPPAGQAGTITAGSTSVLPLTAEADPAGALAQVSGQPAQGSAVQVLSVPADEGFWVGTSDAERVWVQLTGTGESPYQVQEGDTVNFQGTVVAHSAGFAQQVGLGEPDGAAQLDAQGQHIEVEKSAVTLAG